MKDEDLSKIMHIFWILAILPLVESQTCSSVPSDLHGTWTSTNLGTLTISSTARTLSMTKIFSGQTVSANYFSCEFKSGTQYVFRSNDTVASFGGNYIIYICFDFRYYSRHAYYYYLNSDPETGLEGLRMKGFTNAVTSLSQVCETTLHVAEFNTMVKTGFESQAVSLQNCPTPLLASSIFSYTDDSRTYCNGDNATISSCSQPNKYKDIVINSTTCSSSPVIPIFFSSDGILGCLLSVSASDTTYISFYNKDSSLLSTTSQFVCGSLQKVANGTIYMSIFPTDCLSGQNPTTLPSRTVGIATTYGATLELQPTCIPPTTSTTKSWIWLMVLLPLLAAIIILIVVIICLHKRCSAREKRIRREKPAIATEEHPLGEMSIALDAPPSLENVPNGYIDMETEIFKTPRSFRKKGETLNPIGETSMNLSFSKSNWNKLSPRKSITEVSSDPFTEMDSGVIVTLSPEGSKAPKRMQTPRRKSFIFNEERKTPRPKTNNSAGETLAITDGREPYPVVKSPETWESKTVKSERSIKSFLARSVYAASVRAPSMKSFTEKAPSVSSKSTKALSVSARSTKAPGVSIRSTKAPSLSGKSVKAGSTKASSVKGQPSDEKSLVVRSRPKVSRSFTSTKIGSVTKRSSSSPRKKLNRSKTMAVPAVSDTDKYQAGMAEFMNAEMTNWGDSSEIGKSKRSARTPRSKAGSRATHRSTASPRKSILKRKSQFSSSKEFMTEEEIINRIAAGESTPIIGSSTPKVGSTNGSRSLHDEYKDMLEHNDPLSSFKKVKSSKKPWH